MRVLVGPNGDVTDLAALYSPPRTPWLRVNMVSTVDGSATGGSGRSGSINNEADGLVFHALRERADVILVGAGTARTEGYHPGPTPIVLVTRSGEIPPSLAGAPPGTVRMATVSTSAGLAAAQTALGPEHVHVVGEYVVDLARLKADLAAEGLVEQLCEGGPHLLRDCLDQGVADELTLTTVPMAVAGDHPRITAGQPVDVPLELHLLLEDHGTLLARWFVR